MGVKPGKKHKATCQCGFSFWINCHEPWHKRGNWNKTRDKGLVKFQKKPKVKHCPKCHTTIEKNDGWNHMTCHVCKHEFWWLCGKEYTGGGHFTLINGCSSEGEGGSEYCTIAAVIPLIIIIIPLVICLELGKPWFKKCPHLWLIIWFFLFWICISFGIALLVVLPFVYLCLIILYIRSKVKQLWFRS